MSDDFYTADLKRSTRTLDRDVVSSLVKLASGKPWLAERSNELGELWSEFPDLHCRKLLTDLLHRFQYIETAEARKEIEALLKVKIQEWKIDPQFCIVSSLSDKSKTNSGELMLSLVRNVFPGSGWKSGNFITKVDDAIHNLGDDYSLLLVDDFTGTGETIITLVGDINGQLSQLGKKNIRIFYLSIAVMGFAVDVVSKAVDGFAYLHPLKKGIADHDDEGTKKANRILMETMEAALHQSQHFKKYSFGYGKSEALYSLAGASVPDNVFPIFWWHRDAKGDDRITLFRRL